jgi:hypothetical protein
VLEVLVLGAVALEDQLVLEKVKVVLQELVLQEVVPG